MCLTSDVFNTQWAIVDGLGDPETISFILLVPGQVACLSLEVTILKGTRRTFYPRRILHAPGTISVCGSLWSAMSLESEPSGHVPEALSTIYHRKYAF